MNVPGVKRPAIGVAPVACANFKAARYMERKHNRYYNITELHYNINVHSSVRKLAEISPWILDNSEGPPFNSN